MFVTIIKSDSKEDMKPKSYNGMTRCNESLTIIIGKGKTTPGQLDAEILGFLDPEEAFSKHLEQHIANYSG